MAPRISYVVPIYNEEDVIADTTARIVARLESLPGSEVVLVENGSTDSSPALVDRLAEQYSRGSVSVVAAHSAKGYGNAVRHGMSIATGEVHLLTAADLPFGFSDLDAYLALAAPRPELVIGSKAHPDTVIANSRLRRVMSWGFRQLRRVTIGMRVGDSQGTIFLDADLSRRLQPHLTEGAYFFSTELIALAQRCDARIVEVPVDYSAPREGSKVKPLEDSIAMAKSLMALRKRLRSMPTI